MQDLGQKNKDFFVSGGCPVGLALHDDGWGNAVTTLDKLAHREDAAQVDVIVKQQNISILATLQ